MIWEWLQRKKKSERRCEKVLSTRKESIARELETDSDRVIDLGFEFRSDKHEIRDEHRGDGKCKLYCPKTKHVYLHIISVPNKFALLCRGCGETI